MCPHMPLKPNHILALSQSIKRANTRNFCVEIKRRQIHLFFSHKVVSDSFATPQTIAHLAPLSVGFTRQEYWSGLPLPSPGHLPNPRTEPQSPALTGRFFTTVPPGKPQLCLLAFILNMKSSKAWWQWSNKMQTKKTDELTALLYTNWNFISGKKKRCKDNRCQCQWTRDRTTLTLSSL